MSILDLIIILYFNASASYFANSKTLRSSSGNTITFTSGAGYLPCDYDVSVVSTTHLEGKHELGQHRAQSRQQQNNDKRITD